MKRILSVITIVLMLFTMIPSMAFAEGKQSLQSETGTVEVEWVNPLYENITVQLSEPVTDNGIAPVSDDIIYHTSYDAAGEEIRSKLAAHNETIVVRYQMDSSLADPENKWANDVAEGIYKSAVVHTGRSYEGDAIGHAVKRYKASFNYSNNGSYYYMTITYTVTYLHDAAQEAELRDAITVLKAELNIDGKSDYEKIKAIYDYMCKNITYDYDNLEDDSYFLKYSAYAALVNKTSVCEGYAVLFYRLAMEYGIDARVITGSSYGELHAWNIVKLGEKYYNLDATWDAPRSDYEYFLKGSGNFSNHTSNSEFTVKEFMSAYPISDEDYVISYSYDDTCHVGGSIEIAISSAYDQDYIFMCDGADISYSLTGISTQIGTGITKPYIKTYSVTINDPGSWTLRIIGTMSADLTYKVYVTDHIYSSVWTIDKNPTCTGKGSKSHHCTICGKKTDITEIPSTGHTEVTIPAVAVTCETAGATEGIKCSVCNEVLTAPKAIPAKGHSYTSKITEPTCTEEGYTTYTCQNDASHTYKAEETTALGHDIKIKYNNNKMHTENCSRCDYSKTSDCTFDSGVITKDPTESADGIKTFTCAVCGGTYTETVEYVSPIDENVYRIYGADRYATSLGAADVLKADMGVEKFDNIVIASGKTFADALPGSYLAAKKNAPILLISAKNASTLKTYVNNNLKEGGTVYVLGGTAVIPDSWITGMPNVQRLGGANRYETNLIILKAAGVGDASIVLVCTGSNFADSLSASATGQPILLVGKRLNEDQKNYLDSLFSEQYCLIGGTSAVTETVERECETFGNVIRLAGANRYETSVMVANMFFTGPDYAVLAYAKNFPDGLSAGPLAYNMNAPLILTATGSEAQAVSYAAAEKIKYGYVIGGSGLISDNSVRKIFRMSSSDRILNK